MMFRKRLFIILTSLMITLLIYPEVTDKGASALENGLVYTNLLLNSEIEEDSKPSSKDKIDTVFIMDDGWKTQYTQGYRILNKYGFKGCIGIIPVSVGEKNYMTYKEISDLYIKGWSIVNHTYNHFESHKNVSEEVEDIELAKEWMDSRLLKNGSNVYIAPYGRIKEGTIKELKDKGYHSIRTIEEIIVFNDNYEDRKYKIINLTTDRKSEEVIKEIDECINEGRDIIFINHKFGEEDDGEGMTYKVSEFENIVKYIKSKENHIEVRTYSEYIKEK